jgi:hypothetical protein
MLADPVVSRHLFTGFDEVWCFREEPTLAKPDAVSIVAPLNLSTDAVPGDVADWMKSAGCALGLGDGIGMNYVCRDEQTALLLQALASTAGDAPS